jgi:hypothetical protein
MGHGHVTPNPDGSKARCGGPGMCPVCNAELGAQIGDEMNRVKAEQKNADVIQFVRKVDVPAPTKCSFCGKDLVKGQHITNETKSICFECVKTCTELMKG